jgi:hypothetical protein
MPLRDLGTRRAQQRFQALDVHMSETDLPAIEKNHRHFKFMPRR